MFKTAVTRVHVTKCSLICLSPKVLFSELQRMGGRFSTLPWPSAHFPCWLALKEGDGTIEHTLVVGSCAEFRTLLGL